MFDQDNMFSDAQAVTTTAYSDDSVDLGVAGTIPWLGGSPIRDPGRGEPVHVVAQVTTTFTGLTSLQAQLVESDNADLSSHAVLAETAAVPVASLTAGYQFRLGTLPPGIAKRYVGLRYVVVGTGTAGKITAGLTLDRQTSPGVG